MKSGGEAEQRSRLWGPWQDLRNVSNRAWGGVPLWLESSGHYRAEKPGVSLEDQCERNGPGPRSKAAPISAGNRNVRLFVQVPQVRLKAFERFVCETNVHGSVPK